MADAKTWHRMDGESEIAFRAFNVYLNQPLPRSLEYMKRTTTHSQTSIYLWKAKFKWAERVIDYDNTRADQIMAQDVNIMTLYQQRVTEAGLEDMQMLRAAWQQVFEQVTANAATMTVSQRLDAINSLISSRNKLEAFTRSATKMPEKYKAQVVEEPPEANPNKFIQLTLAGPKSEALIDGEYSEREGSTSEQSSSQIVSLTSETEGDQDSPTEI